MKRRESVLYSRTLSYHRGGSHWLGAGAALLFASLPLGVMLWVVPMTGLGFA